MEPSVQMRDSSQRAKEELRVLLDKMQTFEEEVSSCMAPMALPPQFISGSVVEEGTPAKSAS